MLVNKNKQSKDCLFAIRNDKDEARSVSPLCPKHNDCEEPEGAAMEVSTAGMELDFSLLCS